MLDVAANAPIDRRTAGEFMHTAIRFLRSADAYLGHGRALESALILVELQYFLMVLIIPRDRQFIVAFMDVDAPNWLLSLPFAVAFVASFCGLILNAMGDQSAKWFRITGATAGMAIWFFIMTKNVMIGLVAASINPWMLMAIVASLWIIRRGFLGLPRG